MLLALACSRGPRVIQAPVAVVIDSAPVMLRPPEPDTMAAYRVPAFRPAPLVTWGPQPPGDSHDVPTKSWDLQHQSVRLRLDGGRRAVAGSTTLRIAASPGHPAPSSITLDAVGMTILRVLDARGSTIPGHEYDGRTLTIWLPRPLAARPATSITIEYETVRPSRGLRFLPDRGLAWTTGGPAAARHWVPTWDHPSDIATWELRVRAPADVMVLASGRLVSPRPMSGDTEWHWTVESPVPPHGLRIVTGTFVVLQDRWRGIPVGYWAPADSVGAAWRAFGDTPRMMEFLSGQTGIAYPWASYDQVVLPASSAPASVTSAVFAGDAVLHPPWAAGHVSVEAERLIVHALAHQWFGRFVTAHDWSHIWLDESFARFLEAEWIESEGRIDDAEWMRLQVREAAMAADARARRPLVFGRWDEDPSELLDSGHAADRGAAVLEMLRSEVSDSAFREGVKRYLDSHRHGTVATADLRRAMEAASGRALGTFFEQWVLGAGHPAFRVAFDYDSATRSLGLVVGQVQPRDSLTGFFETLVEVTVLTDSGEVRAGIVTRDSLTRATIALRAAPRAIIWGSDDRTLQVADFPRPIVMLTHQLAHALRIPARIGAVRELGRRLDEASAVEALATAARFDAFWGVRELAARQLGGASAEVEGAAAALLEATGDPHARVREAAAGALGALDLADPMLTPLVSIVDTALVPREAPPEGDASTRDVHERRLSRLVTVIEQDSSALVRGAALRSLARLDPARARSAIGGALTRDSWADHERRAAVEALGRMRGAEAWMLVRGLLGASHPETRATAATTLAALGDARRAETVAELRPLLEDPAIVVRLATVDALEMLGDDALAVLTARLTAEDDSTVRRALRAAVERLRNRD